jgi:hypothetical protein
MNNKRIGYSSMTSLTTGCSGVAIGRSQENTTGSNSIMVGVNNVIGGNCNIAIGSPYDIEKCYINYYGIPDTMIISSIDPYKNSDINDRIILYLLYNKSTKIIKAAILGKEQFLNDSTYSYYSQKEIYIKKYYEKYAHLWLELYMCFKKKSLEDTFAIMDIYRHMIDLYTNFV